MNPFDSICIIDWTSGNDTGPKPREDAIWARLIRGSVEMDPVYLRNRTVAYEWISTLVEQERTAGRRVLIGCDFPFGYPKGFGKAVTGSAAPSKIWDFFGDNLEDSPKSNNRFHLAAELNRKFPGTGPFWFNGLKEDIPDLPRKKSDRTDEHGLPEHRVCETRAKGTFTCWQMGGAGAVGGQIMTGMAMVSHLRKDFPGQIAVWPFDKTLGPVLFAETWPSLLGDAVRAAGDEIKDRAQVRLLSRALSRLSAEDFVSMMSVNAPEEGWILGAGHEKKLQATM